MCKEKSLNIGISVMAISRSPKQYLGVRATLPPDLILAKRNPTTSDIAYVKGTIWLNTVLLTVFMYSGTSGLWIPMGSGTVGAIYTINTNVPVSGNYTLAGTANQVAVAQTTGTSTLTIPSVFIAPGSIASTTTITSGTSLAATTSITAGTSITATLGAITATNGNFVKGTAGNKDIYSSVASSATAGANSAGKVTLVGGTATVATTAVTANSLIRLYRQGIGSTGAAALGFISLGTITAGTSFVINSVEPANATLLQASDVSVVFWEIVN
jgi:hypothetical protein